MLIAPKKSQYALRAIFELAKRADHGLTKTGTISSAQSIPRRFLETILGHLKNKGLVTSKRGFYGGYALARPPGQITVGQVLGFLDDAKEPVECLVCISRSRCPFKGHCAFFPFWDRVNQAIRIICNQTTMQDLIDNEATAIQQCQRHRQSDQHHRP
jgi:Rrf2 family protein